MTNAPHELDISARAGLLLASFVAGSSTEPNLLTRGTTDQAIITGSATAVSYGWGASAHSFLRSVADRLPGGRVRSGLVVDVAATAAGAVAMAALRPQPDDPAVKSIARLLAMGVTGAGAAGIGADALEAGRGRRGGRALGIAAMTVVGVTAWSRTRTGRATVGSDEGHGQYFENTPRSISPPKAAALGAATGGILYGLSHAESALSTAFARAAARVLGGSPDDHRTLGRIGATATSYGLGWLAVSGVTAKLTGAGTEVETANVERPTLPEVTGSAESGIPWERQSREGTRWLGEVLRADQIGELMGESAKQPIRVYASLESADSEEGRAELLLRELDRTKAFDRKYIAIFSPTGSGYVNYVACETFEYLTRGNCASAAIEYSVLPSALSLTKAHMGTRQTRLVMDGITRRLLAIPAKRRPKFLMFGESLGSRVSEDMFVGASDAGPRGAGLTAAVWVGTPAFTQWRKQLWGDRPQNEAPKIGPGAVFLPRDVSDWHALSDKERNDVQYLLLQNGDDPVPKFEAPLLWRQPDWLGPDDTRPPGAPRGTRWMPVTTFVATFIDLMNALTPTPGVFDEGGHDYRLEIPEAIRRVWGLPATQEQMDRIRRSMASRELGWEAKRTWDSALAKPADKRESAMAKAEEQIAKWTGSESLDPAAVEALIERDTGSSPQS